MKRIGPKATPYRRTTRVETEQLLLQLEVIQVKIGEVSDALCDAFRDNIVDADSLMAAARQINIEACNMRALATTIHREGAHVEPSNPPF